MKLPECFRKMVIGRASVNVWLISTNQIMKRSALNYSELEVSIFLKQNR